MIRAMTRWTALPLVAALLPLAGCATTGLPAGFAAAATEAPEDTPVRLVLTGDAVTGAAVPLGPGGLPAPVRTTVESVIPGGSVAFSGREWGAHGDGYRIEKRYREAAGESFRSILVDAQGQILERTHSVAMAKVPPVIARMAMTVGRDLRRCDIVSDATRETAWRAIVGDGLGHTHIVTLDLSGNIQDAHRVVQTQVELR
jgi:hypothetical protein